MRDTMQPTFSRRALQEELALLYADRRYPPRHYERHLSWVELLLLELLLIGPVFLLYGLQPPGWLVLAVIGIHVGSVVFDTYTTHITGQIAPEYQSRELTYPLYESNPYLPDAPTLRQQILGVPTLADMIAILVGLMLPGFTIMILLGHLRAGLNNLRHHKRMVYQLKAYDKMVSQDRKKRKEMPLKRHLFAIPTATG